MQPLVSSLDGALSKYGNEQLLTLVDFYGKEASVGFDGMCSFPSSHFAECRVFKRALAWKEKAIMATKKLSKPLTLQDVKTKVGVFKNV